MGNILLYNEGMMPGAPRTPLSPAPLPAVRLAADSSGLMQAAAQAYEQPLLPEGAFQGGAQAGAAWGKALQNLGGMLEKVAQDRLQAKNYADLEHGQGVLRTTREKFEGWKASHPDPDTWEPEWTRQLEGLQKTLAEDRRYSPQVRRQLEGVMERYALESTVHVSTEAAKATFQRAREAGIARAQRSLQSGRLDAAKETLRHMEQQGWLDPQSASAISEQMAWQHAAAERTKWIEETPGLVVRTLTGAPPGEDAPWPFQGSSPEQRGQYLNAAQKQLAQQQVEAVQRVVADFESGRPIAQAGVPGLLKEHDPLLVVSPEVAELLQARSEGRYPASKDISDDLIAIEMLDPWDDPGGLQRLQLETRLYARYPSEQATPMVKRLEERYSVDRTVDPGLVQGLQRLRDLHQVEGLGVEYRGDRLLAEVIKAPENLEALGLGWLHDDLNSPMSHAERLALFRKNLAWSKAMPQFPYNLKTLDPLTQELFEKELAGETYEFEDRKRKSEGRLANLTQEFIQWFRSSANGREDEEIKKWFDSRTRPLREERAAAIAIGEEP